ncbi:MAG: hypothetical protein K8F25_14255, partial [Fimbriimonadaceae bacterium]|nr:hypothetical protein [Alphaproteobacteria bacterium]
SVGEQSEAASANAPEKADEKPKKRAPRRRTPARKKDAGEAKTESPENIAAPEPANDTPVAVETADDKPKKAPARRRSRKTETQDAAQSNGPAASHNDTAAPAAKEKAAQEDTTPALAANKVADEPVTENQGPPRRGWWRRATP